jgi:hypothetical protein
VRRWSIRRKILCLAMLNLLLIAAVMMVFLRTQFHFGPESILFGPAHERMLAVTNEFRLELESATPEVRPGILEAYGRRFNAEFKLIDLQGNALIGPRLTLPNDLI